MAESAGQQEATIISEESSTNNDRKCASFSVAFINKEHGAPEAIENTEAVSGEHL